MKKIILITAITITIITGIVILKRSRSQTSSAKFTIGILQTASHPALDASRQGFIEKLKSKMGNTVEFVIQNAQGSIAQAHAIAQQFHANPQLTAFFTIATPAAQAMSSVEKEKPIFIAAVTDPSSLGLITPNTNVCGTKDMINVNKTVNLITQLVPSAKTIGLLYTNGETNALVVAKLMRQALEAQKFTVFDFTVNSDVDMPVVTELACRKCDLILCPTDNTVAATISLISTITNKSKKPLIVSDNLLVAQGALAAQGVDYQQNGEKTAQIAYQVLIENQKPATLPITQSESVNIYINQKTLANLNLVIPETINQKIILV